MSTLNHPEYPQFPDRLRKNWIAANENIGGKSHLFPLCFPQDAIHSGWDAGVPRMHRPRRPLSPGHSMDRLPDYAPIRDLYRAATIDLSLHDIDARDLYLYTLVQSGEIPAGLAQRADFWHMDLDRLLRHRRNHQIPVAINYSATNAMPTQFVSELPEPLRAAGTARNPILCRLLGENAKRLGHIFEARAGQIIRYDTMTLHRGGVNRSDKPVQRAFVHLAFSPVGC